MYSIAKKHTRFLSVRLKKICDVLLAESPREILYFEKKKLVIIPSRITAARPSWSLNNHGPLRGFTVWSGVHFLQCGCSFCTAVWRRQSLRCSQVCFFLNLNETSLAYIDSCWFWFLRNIGRLPWYGWFGAFKQKC